MEDHIISVLQKNGPMQTEALRRTIGHREGRNVGRLEIRDRLISLVAAGRVFSTPKGHGFLWSLVGDA